MGGKATIAGIAGEIWLIAEIFAIREAVGTVSASVPKPRHANPAPDPGTRNALAHGIDNADDFVTGNQRQFWVTKIPINDMQIGPADRACLDLQPYLTDPR